MIRRPECDGCGRNLLTQNAWLTTADGEELCISCVEARERRARIERALNPERPAWLQAMYDEARAKVEADRGAGGRRAS